MFVTVGTGLENRFRLANADRVATSPEVRCHPLDGALTRERCPLVQHVDRVASAVDSTAADRMAGVHRRQLNVLNVFRQEGISCRLPIWIAPAASAAT
jgi:hypothetical protein